MLDLKSLKSEFSTYGEIRHQVNRNFNLASLNGEIIENRQSANEGISARCYSHGYWGFASHSLTSKESALQTLKAATGNATFLSSKAKKGHRLATGGHSSLNKSFMTQKKREGVSTWMELVRGLDSMIARKYPKLRARSVRLMALDMEKRLINSEGAEGHTVIPRAHLALTMTMDSDHGPVTYRDIRGGLGNLEDQFSFGAEHFESWMDKVYERVSHKARGIMPEAGIHDVILASDLAGILAHEAVGHTTEADIVLGGSVAGDHLNQSVASPLISLVDFAHTAYGQTCPQPIYIDDEGVVAEDTVIIENGILKSFMNNKETAERFNMKPTGHARAFEFSDEPLIRMRNTAILPGTSKLEEMIASIDHGYLLENPGNGQADTTGEFMFAVTSGYEIKDGKVSRPLRDVTISGVAFEMLKTVTMVSDEFTWESSGYCGKKQPMPVGMAGPSIKCKVQLGGQ